LSLQVAKVKGIPIKLHFTLGIVFVLIAWTLAVSYMPLLYPDLPQSAYWTMGILGAIFLFISVLLHELSHSMVAKRYGFKVRQIILFVFGGVSDIPDEPREDYKKEFTIAIVGPISSFALAGLFAVVWFILIQVSISTATTTTSQGERLFALPQLQQQEQAQTSSPTTTTTISEEAVAGSIAQGIMRYGIIVNILLGGFNLLPAFPLDGGRVLRAGLMRWKGNYHDATKTAVNVGVGISYGLMALGFLTIFSGSFTGGIWLILIGWFLQSGAQSYLQQHEITTALSGVRLYQIMNTQFIAVTPGMNIKEVLEGYFNIYRKSELPVVEKEDGTGNQYLLGSITAKDTINVSEKNRENVKVQDIMIEKKELVIMSPDRTADVALNTIMEHNKSRIYVCENPSVEKSSTRRTEEMHQQQELMTTTHRTERSDRLVGLISKTDILNVAKERMEYTQSMKKRHLRF
jgi:Zn-dependent protease/predicted transcriptional regulator